MTRIQDICLINLVTKGSKVLRLNILGNMYSIFLTKFFLISVHLHVLMINS